MKLKKNEFEKKQKFNNQICYLMLSFHTGVSTISDIAIQYFFKDHLKLQPGVMSQVISLSLIPWMLKPIFGIITDFCPLFGYRRKYYIILSGIVDIICWLLMAFHTNSIQETTVLLFIINMSLAFSSVLGEAIVVELSKLNTNEEHRGDNAKDYVSLFFIFKDVGALASSYLKGYFVDIMSLRTIFLISASTPISIIIAGLLMVDKKIKSKEERQQERDLKNKSSIIVDPEKQNLLENEIEKKNEISVNITTLTNSSIEIENKNLFKELFNFIFQKFIIVPIIFIIIYMGVPSYDDPLFYFLTNKLKFNGNILGQISFVSALTAIIAVLIYKLYLKNVGFKVMITIGSLLYFCFSFSAYLLVIRYNLKLGISDYVMCLFSSSTTSMLGEFILMPILSLACILCPKNLEATVYSFFMSALNFGSILSFMEGSFFTKFYSVTSDNFDHLPSLILTSNIIGIVPLLLLFCINDSYFNPVKKENN